MRSGFNIKICGITRTEDALSAWKLGADMIGFIFYKKSKRYITLSAAWVISKELPPTLIKVGVFVDEEIEKVLKTARKLKLDFVQLGGNESNRYIKDVHKHGFKVIKTYFIRKSKDYDKVYRSAADIVQLDNGTSTTKGGTGESFDWSIKPPRKINNLMISGGINADNLKLAVNIFKPIIVDVNSGIESSPGIKSLLKMKRFVNEADKIRYGKK